MEEEYTDPKQSPDPPALSENQEANNRVKKEVIEEAQENLPEGEKVDESITPQKITNLQRELTVFVSNIQTAVDARESMRRKEVEEAHKVRSERLENHVKSSQEKFEEITRGWLIVKEKATLQELRKARDSQQQLCALLLEDKKKIINDLQQEMKAGDDRYVKDLRKEAEELDLMIERMEDNMKTLKKAYREEMGQIKRVYQQQNEVIRTRDVTEWEQLLTELWDREQGRLQQRREKVEEYEDVFHRLMLKNVDSQNSNQVENNAKIALQVTEREQQKKTVDDMVKRLAKIRQEYETEEHKVNLGCMKKRALSLQAELKNLVTQNTNYVKRIRETRRHLSKKIKRSIQQYERTQKKIKYFIVADATKFEEMWITVEAEVKQLVERALVTDSLICKQHLGLAWKRPPMAFMELSGPIQPQKQAHKAASELFPTGQALQCSQGTMDTSDWPRLEAEADSTDMEMSKEGTVGQGEGDAEVEDGKLSMDTLKKVMELLCDEAGFLMEDALLKLLAPLEKEEQIIVKMGSLLCSFGIEEEDVAKLVHFFLKEKTEDVCGEQGESSDQAEAVESSSTSNLTSDLIHPNHVLPALKSFLKQHMREKKQTSFLEVEVRDSSEDEAYWESMGNIISEDKVKLWELAETTLHQYLEVLSEISEFIPEAEGLWQQNTELRMLLEQSLVSKVVHQTP
ncbi:dynein regulatory complex protein 1 isoform X2 [Seriola lalandi dorsalis]|uniref:dynein regulatory complex protein 1 isoform X2 n=1 Tax=Seriola lalandi dorsalis TaxID=1841481 RepID=UPI000C6FA8E3|nr:dynein regulatory complex protein 1 isoform X2 [Seriola lalandi dorsalis]XP_056261605.1 dynein regulatory complex protein 1 isoform X2 [Seriola aureovittata]